MKKLIALLLALTMVLALAACGKKEATIEDAMQTVKDAVEAEESEEVEEPEEETKEEAEPEAEPEPEILDVTIGDYYVVHQGAYEYGSDDFGDYFLVLVEFTSNADQAYMPYTRVYIEAKQDDALLKGISWTELNTPNADLMGQDRVECEPGATVNYYNGFHYNPEGGPITITYMDNAHTLEETLVVEIDPATLETYVKPE